MGLVYCCWCVRPKVGLAGLSQRRSPLVLRRGASSRVGGWARWLWRARSPPPSAPLGLRPLAKEQYDEDRQGSLGVYPFHLPFGQRLLAKGSTRGSVAIIFGYLQVVLRWGSVNGAGGPRIHQHTKWFRCCSYFKKFYSIRVEENIKKRMALLLALLKRYRIG